MKKYFVPHIIKCQIIGKYRIRKFHLLFGWKYLDYNDNYWWSRLNNYSIYNSIDDATKRYEKHRASIGNSDYSSKDRIVKFV